MLKRLFLVYLCLWLSLLSAGAFISFKFIISSQVAFFASVLIMTATFYSYKRRVQTRVENEREEILAMQKEEDDELWDDDDKNSQEAAEASVSLKDEKARLKAQKRGLKDMNLTTAFVPYRLLTYAALVVGFLALQRREMLDIAGFLVGLAFMPVGAFVFGIANKNR